MSLANILVVDDDQDNAEMMRLLLETQGCNVVVAYDGRSGLDAARSFKPDVVLCDLMLAGDMDGFEVAAEMKQDPRLSGSTLIAVSGFARPEDRESALAAGFDDHLAKPVDLATLQRVLQEAPRLSAS